MLIESPYTLTSPAWFRQRCSANENAKKILTTTLNQDFYVLCVKSCVYTVHGNAAHCLEPHHSLKRPVVSAYNLIRLGNLLRPEAMEAA